MITLPRFYRLWITSGLTTQTGQLTGPRVSYVGSIDIMIYAEYIRCVIVDACVLEHHCPALPGTPMNHRSNKTQE